MSRTWVIGGAGACQEQTSLRNDEDSVPIGWIRGHEKWPLLEVKGHVSFVSIWIEVRVKSLKNDGSLSVPEGWTSMWKNLAKKWRIEGIAAGMEKPVVTKHKETNMVHHHHPSPKCSYQLTNGSRMLFLPSTTWAKDPCRTESQRLWQILRLHASHREDDGAIDWNTLLFKLSRDCEYENAWIWTNQEWLGLLQKGSDKKQISVLSLFTRSHSPHACQLQSHSGGAKVELTLLDLVQIPYNWSEYFFSRWLFPAYALYCSHQDWLQEQRCKRRNTNSMLHHPGSMSDAQEEEYQDVSKPRKVHHKSKWKVIQDR